MLPAFFTVKNKNPHRTVRILLTYSDGHDTILLKPICDCAEYVAD